MEFYEFAAQIGPNGRGVGVGCAESTPEDARTRNAGVFLFFGNFWVHQSG